MKTTSSFKLPKPVKRLLSTLNGEARALYKKMMIQACHEKELKSRKKHISNEEKVD